MKFQYIPGTPGTAEERQEQHIRDWQLKKGAEFDARWQQIVATDPTFEERQKKAVSRMMLRVQYPRLADVEPCECGEDDVKDCWDRV